MRIIILILISAFLFSCSKENKNTSNERTEDKTNSSPTTEISNEIKLTLVPDSIKQIYGYYTGEFVATEYDESSPYTYSNKITVSVDSIAGDILFGHSLVAGNDRPFSGRYVYEKGTYAAQVSEPGDDKYDGIFSFTIEPNLRTITGKWDSFKNDIYVTQREYELKKRDFVYNKNNNIPSDKNWNSLYEQNPKFPDKIESLTEEISNINASNTLLRKSDIDNLYKGDLEVIRNAIYARHGYSFKNRKMRYFFDNHIDWYMPVSTDVRNELTELEIKNIDLLKRYEEHAEQYYDEYGR